MDKKKRPNWPVHNLQELVSFLSRQHSGEIRLSAVSEKLGCSIQAVSAKLIRDDCDLSWVEKLASKYGYNLCLELAIPLFLGDNSEGNTAAKVFPNAGNLMGLAEYAVKRGMTINSMAAMLHLNYRVVERALKTGNVKVSTLLSIAKRLDIQIKWKWEPKDLVA